MPMLANDTCDSIGIVFSFEIPNVLNVYSPKYENKVFQPIGYGVKNIKMNIYTVRGECIFKGFAEQLKGYNTPELAWDGKFKGEYCPVGVYVYIIQYSKCGNSKEETIKGMFQLLQ